MRTSRDHHTHKNKKYTQRKREKKEFLESNVMCEDQRSGVLVWVWIRVRGDIVVEKDFVDRHLIDSERKGSSDTT